MSQLSYLLPASRAAHMPDNGTSAPPTISHTGGNDMREFLSRREFPATVLALGIIILTPTPLRADTHLPLVTVWEIVWGLVVATAPLIIMGLVLIVLIESFVLCRRLRLKWARALR